MGASAQASTTATKTHHPYQEPRELQIELEDLELKHAAMHECHQMWELEENHHDLHRHAIDATP